MQDDDRLQRLLVSIQGLIDEQPDFVDRISIQIDSPTSTETASGVTKHQPVGDCKYWAFISYSHRDTKWGDWLHNSLERYRVPARLVGQVTASGVVPRRIFPVFRDRAELAAASELTGEIQAALKSSRFLIVICSIESAKSRWVNKEVKFFKQFAGSRRVLSVIVDGEPNAWDGSQECFPEAIKYEVSPGGQVTDRPSEPIAADARRQGDGKFNAKLKILSGLLGVKYDDLRRREQLRRRQRVKVWSTVIGMILLVASLYVRSLQQENWTQQRMNHATDLVTALLKAETSQVPSIIEQIRHYREWADPKLAKEYERAKTDSTQKLHAALALLPVDESKLEYLSEQLLVATPAQFPTVRDTLLPQKQELIDRYWEIVLDTQQAKPRRFQAACALATYDPENEFWQNEELSFFLADHLVNVLPSDLLAWRNALRPLKDDLFESLVRIYRNGNEGEKVRSFATDLLADYLRDYPDRLFDLLADASQKQYEIMFAKLLQHQSRAIELGKAEIRKRAAEDASPQFKEVLAMRQANAAVMLLRMNATEEVWPLLNHSPDPRLRSYITNWLLSRGGDANMIISQYDEETDVSTKRALLLCLGELRVSELPESDRKHLIEKLIAVYRSDFDAGLHAAAEWLLRQWGQGENIDTIDHALQQSEEQLRLGEHAGRQWYINGQRQTFVILDADEFRMGSPESEDGRFANEDLHSHKIERRIAISAKEVTHAQWRVFAKTQAKAWQADQKRLRPFIPSDDSPMLAMNWYEAAWYCNWLSEQEGIGEGDWCYRPNENSEYGPGMKAKENFLELSGYRLPTEAEWEFACRAGAVSSRYYGETETLLPEYAWFVANGEDHAHPVAKLKPNDWGLFDVLGNAYEWCYPRREENRHATAETVSDETINSPVTLNQGQVLRGGSFAYPASFVRCAFRSNHKLPGVRDSNDGFRPARTYDSDTRVLPGRTQ